MKIILFAAQIAMWGVITFLIWRVFQLIVLPADGSPGSVVGLILIGVLVYMFLASPIAKIFQKK